MVKPPVKERPTPRISVNELAAFMVASDTSRLSIIRRSKFVSTPPIIRYRDVRPVVSKFLADNTRPVNLLVSAEEMFEQRVNDKSLKALAQDDARKSIEVIHSIQQMGNKVAEYGFQLAPKDQPKLMISGVEVSIWADLLVTGVVKKTPHVGAAVLRFNQDDADTEAAIQKRAEMGRYVATVVLRHVLENFEAAKPISNKLCMSIDVQHGEVFCAPDSNTRRMSDIENACKFIAAMWDTVT